MAWGAGPGFRWGPVGLLQLGVGCDCCVMSQTVVGVWNQERTRVSGRGARKAVRRDEVTLGTTGTPGRWCFRVYCAVGTPHEEASS